MIDQSAHNPVTKVELHGGVHGNRRILGYQEDALIVREKPSEPVPAESSVEYRAVRPEGVQFFKDFLYPHVFEKGHLQNIVEAAYCLREPFVYPLSRSRPLIDERDMPGPGVKFQYQRDTGFEIILLVYSRKKFEFSHIRRIDVIDAAENDRRLPEQFITVLSYEVEGVIVCHDNHVKFEILVFEFIDFVEALRVQVTEHLFGVHVLNVQIARPHHILQNGFDARVFIVRPLISLIVGMYDQHTFP